MSSQDLQLTLARVDVKVHVSTIRTSPYRSNLHRRCERRKLNYLNTEQRTLSSNVKLVDGYTKLTEVISAKGCHTSYEVVVCAFSFLNHNMYFVGIFRFMTRLMLPNTNKRARRFIV